MPANYTRKNIKKNYKIIIPIMMIAVILLITGCTVEYSEGKNLVISDEVITTDYYRAVIPAGWTILYTSDDGFSLRNEIDQNLWFHVDCDEGTCVEALTQAKEANEESIKNGERPEYIITEGTLNGIKYFEIIGLRYGTYYSVYEYESSVYFPTESNTYKFYWDLMSSTQKIYGKWMDDEKTVEMILSIVAEGETENERQK